MVAAVSIINKGLLRVNAFGPKIRANGLRFASSQRVVGDHVGLPMKFYIPPSFKKYPNILTSPLLWVRLVARRLYVFGRNTAQVGYARWSGDFKPEFLLWKNQAVDTYVMVNKAFAKRKIESVADRLTVWSREPLKNRQESLPDNYEFDWKLLKLVKPPKLEMFLPYAIPGQPLEKVLLIYKIHSEQRLVKFNKLTEEVTKTDESIENHLAFVVDLPTNHMKLCGSTFESDINDSTDMIQPKNVGTVMQIQGDIFRHSDDLLKNALKKESVNV